MKLSFAVGTVLICSSIYAAATSEEGNSPLSPANYTDWPNLVDAINDKSRVFQTWVNGAENFYYNGNTQAANRVLKEFAETQYPDLQVVLLPGPAPLSEVLGKKVTFDYRIEIMGGIAHAAIERGNLKRIYFLQPTMTIHISEEVELEKLKLPANVRVLQLRDLEERYRSGLDDPAKEVQRTAKYMLDHLNKEFLRQGKEYQQLEKQLANIEQYVASRKSKSSDTSE